MNKNKTTQKSQESRLSQLSQESKLSLSELSNVSAANGPGGVPMCYDSNSGHYYPCYVADDPDHN